MHIENLAAKPPFSSAIKWDMWSMTWNMLDEVNKVSG